MELLHGETAQQRAAQGPLDVAGLVDAGIALADALETAHAAGIVHRDIKPANVVLTARGPKILDFGVAQIRPAAPASSARTALPDPQLTSPGTAVGTVAYMSPEQLQGEALDARSDLFSLGLVLFELATGRPAFTGGTSSAIAGAILHHAPALPSSLRPGLPSRIDEVILKALEKDRALRYQGAAEMRADLQRLKRDSDAAAVVPLAPSRPAARALRQWPAMVAVASLLAVGFAAWDVYRRPPPPLLTDTATLVLADFVNTTGDPVFDDTLRQGLAVPAAAVAVSQPGLGSAHPPDAAVDGPCRRRTPDRGSRQRGLRAHRRRRHARGLDRQPRHAVRARTARRALRQRRRPGRGTGAGGEQGGGTRRLEPSRQHLQSPGRRIAEHRRAAQSSARRSQHAVARRAQGVQRRGDLLRGTDAALPFYRRAIEIDPGFAMAHARMGLALSIIGESELAARSTSEAFRLRDRATDRERFFITATYQRQVTGNLEAAQRTFETWGEMYPRDITPPALSSGFTYKGTGDYDKAIAQATRALTIDPDFVPAHLNLVFCNLYLERFREARQVVERMAARKIDPPDLRVVRYLLAFLEGDRVAMDREADAATGDSQDEIEVQHVHALTTARSGQIRQARTLSRRAVELTRKAGQHERAAVFQTGAAVWEAFYGYADAAQQSARDALRITRGRDVVYGAAFALALTGEVAEAQTLADELAKRFPEDTSVQTQYLPTLRGLLALQRKEAGAAITHLEAAFPNELGIPATNFVAWFGSLYSAYVRGQAFAGPRSIGRGRRRVPEDPRPSRPGFQRSRRRDGPPAPGPCARRVGRSGEGAGGLRGRPDAVDRRRPRLATFPAGEG